MPRQLAFAACSCFHFYSLTTLTYNYILLRTGVGLKGHSTVSTQQRPRPFAQGGHSQGHSWVVWEAGGVCQYVSRHDSLAPQLSRCIQQRCCASKTCLLIWTLSASLVLALLSACFDASTNSSEPLGTHLDFVDFRRVCI